MERLNNVIIEEFLNDYTENSETILLEEGKEKSELEKIAKARGMDITARDLGFFKTVYAFINEPNANGAILPKNELIKVLPQIIGKPININHDRDKVVGHYIDFRYRQKENEAIAYGVYYKTYYIELWKKAQELFKKKKLSSSFEIWSPKDKRKYYKDGTYELHNMEIAGGALIYEDKDNAPAFKNAKVLMMANDDTALPELVYASKYKEDEILMAGQSTTATLIKVKCSNCGEEFEVGEGQVSIKCPKCFAILDNTGNMKYPPQVKDFKILCPSCKVNNWLIISRDDEKAKLKCMNCSKEYNITFAKNSKTNPLFKSRFIYSGHINCPQCNAKINIEGISDVNVRQVACPKCGLKFYTDSYKETSKRIATINETKDKANEPTKASEKGGKNMAEKIHDFLESTEEDNKKVISERLEKVKAKEEKKPEAPVSEDLIEVEDIDVTVKEIEGDDEIEKSAKFNCECIKCGFSKASDSHCKDLKCPKCGGQMRRKERPGAGQPGKSEQMTTKTRKALPDSLFAIVKTVKNKRTGEPRKIRMFPINDQVHVRNALARLAQTKVKETLKKLGVSADSVRNKILKRARELKMTTLLKRYQKAMKKHQRKLRKARKDMKTIITETSKREEIFKAGVRKAIKQHLDESKKSNNTQKKLEAELAKVKKNTDKKIKFYQENAKKILERQEIIGKDYLTDEEIVNDDKFERARLSLEKARAKTNKDTASEIVGSKINDDGYYRKIKKQIDDVAFGRNK